MEISNTKKDNMPLSISLNHCIPRFTKGVLGMQEGEKRKLYIHPDLAYCKTDRVIQPQSLLIIDVELIQTNISSIL